MGLIINIILALILISAFTYSWYILVGADNVKGINIQLDEVYNNTKDMAHAVVEELKKQGKKCEIIELGPGFPKLLIKNKKYVLTYRNVSAAGFPVQTIQLKPLKNKK